MNIQVDIVTGFLGSGKTTLINSMLQKDTCAGETTVVIQNEWGEKEIDDEILKNPDIHLEKRTRQNSLDALFFAEILQQYCPSRVIIELNGMQKTQDLLKVFTDKKIPGNLKIKTIITVIDAATFDNFMANIGAILTEQISICDVIIVNNAENPKNRLSKKTLQSINPAARITWNDSTGHASSDDRARKKRPPARIPRPDKFFFLILIALAASCLAAALIRAISLDSQNLNVSRLIAVNTVFLSILIEAFPFILFGVLISSALQVLVSSETVIKLFPRKKVSGFLVAVCAGLFFPVCDCAVIPVAARLIKKGVPLPTAITFMLAAPIVNPLVILSTYYAFPGQPGIVLYRVGLGAVIALTAGVAMLALPENRSFLLDGFTDCSCDCCSCHEETVKTGVWGKLEEIFSHAGAEFFDVGRYLITGALLSSIFQTMVPKDIIVNTGGGFAVSLLLMMLFAFILSVCSTSDAFIARTFLNQFPLGAVMGFMILGPMVDMKNLLMLLGRFKKRFVFVLVLIIFGLSYALLFSVTSLFS